MRNVISNPISGEKFSVIETVDMSNIEEGTGLPVDTSFTNPLDPVSFMNDENVLYEPTAYIDW